MSSKVSTMYWYFYLINGHITAIIFVQTTGDRDYYVLGTILHTGSLEPCRCSERKLMFLGLQSSRLANCLDEVVALALRPDPVIQRTHQFYLQSNVILNSSDHIGKTSGTDLAKKVICLCLHISFYCTCAM